jgi:hypothetical protein
MRLSPGNHYRTPHHPQPGQHDTEGQIFKSFLLLFFKKEALSFLKKRNKRLLLLGALSPLFDNGLRVGHRAACSRIFFAG